MMFVNVEVTDGRKRGNATVLSIMYRYVYSRVVGTPEPDKKTSPWDIFFSDISSIINAYYIYSIALGERLPKAW